MQTQYQKKIISDHSLQVLARGTEVMYNIFLLNFTFKCNFKCNYHVYKFYPGCRA